MLSGRWTRWEGEDGRYELQLVEGPGGVELQLVHDELLVLEAPLADFEQLKAAIDAVLRAVGPTAGPEVVDRAGTRWTVDEERRMLAMWREGAWVRKIALVLGRTESAIKTRLVRADVVADPEELRRLDRERRHGPSPTASA